ncbi:MAG: hypothetical protein LLF95_11375 [Bacteroidales bacterium]|nr:hypothetical protein [Bacteroidales bacterium]
MNLDELIQALTELKESGRVIDKEPVYYLDKLGNEYPINVVKHFQNVFGQIELYS